MAPRPPRPRPGSLFARAKSNQKHAREEKPFRWGFSPVTPSSATTQRGARVGTSSASLILPQAAGFARCAAPPSSSANAALVCLGAAPAGPYFTDSRWINPVRRWKCLAGLGGAGGESKEGAAAPSLVVVGEGYIREGPHRKGPSLVRLFGYFFGVEKVTRGVGLEVPLLGGSGVTSRKLPGLGRGGPGSSGYGARGPEEFEAWERIPHTRTIHTAREKIFPFRLLTSGLTSDMVSYTSNEPLNQQRRDLVE